MFLLYAFANILYLTGITRVIDTPPNVRPVTGKSMRHALRTWFRDSTARFLSLTPSFRRKERKMPANFCFGLDARTRPLAQLFFTQLLIVFESRIFHHRTTRVSVTLASSPLERTSEILSFPPALFSRNYDLLLPSCGKTPSDSRFLYDFFFSTLY